MAREVRIERRGAPGLDAAEKLFVTRDADGERLIPAPTGEALYETLTAPLTAAATSVQQIGEQVEQQAEAFFDEDEGPLALRVRTDAPQTFTTAQRLQALQNIGTRAYETIERWGGGVGKTAAENDVAIEAAIISACARRVPIVLYGRYLISQTIKAEDRIVPPGATPAIRSFKGFVGSGMYDTGFAMQANNIPIMQLKGQDKVLEGLYLEYVTLQTETATASVCLDITDVTSFCRLTQLRMANGYRGMDASGGQGLFSCVVDTVRFIDNFDISIVGNASRGTGNVLRNIYASAQNRDRVNWLLGIIGQVQGSVSQINCEHANCIKGALQLNTSDAVFIDGVNFEGIRLFDDQAVGFIQSTAAWPIIRGLSVTLCHVGGYTVTGVVVADGTVICTIGDLGGARDMSTPYGTAFRVSGHGFRVGDTITFGAPTGNTNLVGSKTVTAVTKTTVSFADATGDATFNPAAAGADYVAVHRGAGAGVRSALINFDGVAEGMKIETVQFRSLFPYGPTTATRNALFSWVRNASAATSAGRLIVEKQIRRGRAGGLWDRDNPILAVSRPTTTALAFHFQYKHGLKAGDVFRTTATVPLGAPGNPAVANMLDDFTVTVGSSGVVTDLTPVSGTPAAVYAYLPTASVSRSSNIATWKMAAPHGLQVGTRLRIFSALNGSFTRTEAQVLSVSADGLSFTYYNSGTNVAETSDTTAAVMVLEGVYPVSNLRLPSGDVASMLKLGDTFRAVAVVPGQTIPAEGLTPPVNVTIFGARQGDRVANSLYNAADLPATCSLRCYVSANDTLAVQVAGPSGVVLPILKVGLELVR